MKNQTYTYQDAAPLASLYVPKLHGIHEVKGLVSVLGNGLNVPSGQLPQAVEPSLVLN